MENLASTPSPRVYGSVSGEMAESFAWLNSPARIAGEIAHFTRAIADGHDTPQNHAQLADWRAIRAAQQKLIAEQEGDAR